MKQEDETNQVSRDRLTFEVARQIGDSICHFIKLTTDTPDESNGGYMPVLDLQVKMGGENNRRVVYKFYSKKVSTRYTILQKSAHSVKTKFSTLTQECVRRLLNTSELVPREEKIEIMEQYNNRLKRSGYDGKYRERVIRAAHEIYADKVKQHREGTRPLHRSKMWKKEERQQQKDLGKTHWYRKGKKGGGTAITHAPLIINPSHESKLTDKIKKICQETADLTGIRVKVMERGGNKIANDAKSDPLAEPGCKRTACGICQGEDKGKCSQYGITYEVCCLDCKEEDVNAQYIGETGRNGFSRKAEHDQAVNNKYMNNALAKHCAIQHNGNRAKFSMRVTGTYRTCLERQEAEAVKIRRAQATVDILMNSRNDFHQPPIRRVVTELGNSQMDQPGAEALGLTAAPGTRGRGRGRGRAANRGGRQTDQTRPEGEGPTTAAGPRGRGRGRGRGGVEGRGTGTGRPRGRPRRIQELTE
jgi:hypothetical protein